MKKKNKLYRVSIAGTVPINYEFTVKAKSEEEAFNIAMKAYENPLATVFTSDPLWDFAEMDSDISSHEDCGVYIEELDE